MAQLWKKYTHWLHSRWPAGVVEKLPEVDENGLSNIPGLYIVGDLTGIPLLKFSSDSGARAIQHIVADGQFQAGQGDDDTLDVAIIGAGVSGMAAALEARKAGLRFAVLEATQAFSTVVNFPKGKPIFTYPTEMVPAGDLQFTASVKEPLVAEMKAQTLEQGITPRMVRVEQVVRRGEVFDLIIPGQDTIVARRVVVGIGRSGNFRKLGVEGQDLDKVSNRLHDPMDYGDKDVLVVGGGDSALETAIAVAQCGARVTLSYRKPEFARPKPDNIEKIEMLSADPEAAVAVELPSSERVTTSAGAFLEGGRRPGSIRLMMASQLKRVEEESVVVEDADGAAETLPNDAVFSMIGREPPLDFFRRSGVHIRGEFRRASWISMGLIMLACLFIYHWKTDAGIPVKHWFQEAGLFPFNIQQPTTSTNLIDTLLVSMGQPSFYYSLVYCLCVVGFGIRRMQRRRTPYVKVQTITLMLVQTIPLFLLPYIFLPWAGHNGWFAPGALLTPVADALFPISEWAEHGREYWRTLGLVLAWPLFFWNVFTDQPLWTWLAISAVQTFVLIPLIIWRWGKGAYCGWICSCGALAETMGDAHRHKMPHGPFWNRLNMVGQVVLFLATAILLLRLIGWVLPYEHWVNDLYRGLFLGKAASGDRLPFPFSFLNYVWAVDLLLAGIVGVGFYWHFSGRVWCRFACPLAALMHIYARFSRFRILADKKKCISCNACTSVCHQGIDIMNFANKGLPMADPQCVRCSACVETCPTGVLQFGQVDNGSGDLLSIDALAASPVLMRESKREA
ncbi:MAG: 4Fe-4S binding protein [Candidatus Latescibacteria bacterium]|nr:4Fe-4S binding protein [Candidatus Latescibacterota bacterium]